MKKSGSSNQLLSLEEDESERDQERSGSASVTRNRNGSPICSRGRSGSASPTRNTEKAPKTPFSAQLSSTSKPVGDLTRSHRSFSELLPEFQVPEETKTQQPSESKMRQSRSARSISQLSPAASPSDLALSSAMSPEGSPSSPCSEAVVMENKRVRSRRISCSQPPTSLAENLKSAIEEGMPSPKPLSFVLLHSVSVERVFQLLVVLLLMSSALLPGELPIGDCVAMVAIYAVAIVVELVLTVKLKTFNFAADHINAPALLRDAETMSDEVRNVHLNKSISTIAVQREENGVISFERNMAAVVPVNSVVKFHPSEKNNLPVGITELANVKSGSRWTYAFVSQNLAVDCLKRLLQRPLPPSFDPMTLNIQRTLNRTSWLLIAIATAVLFAFVRTPSSDLSPAFLSIAVLLMPLLPSMLSLSLSLSVAVINASISSHSRLSSSADDVSSRRGSLTYSRLKDSAQDSPASKWFCSSFIAKFASSIRRVLQVSVLPAVSDDNNQPVVISLVSVIRWLFSSWNRMFHECNHMHMMGRITVLCVLDKEGILAEPQPDAKYVMYARTVCDDEGSVPSRARSIHRSSSTSAADIVDASFLTVPIIQNDSGKWEFRFENDPDKVEEKRSLEIFRQIAVCSQLTTDKLDIDEDVPKPANACVKGLLDLCTLINEQFDDKSVQKLSDKVPIWKKHVDLLSPGISIAFVQRRGPWHETLDVSMSGGVQKVLYDKTVSNTINREFHFQQYAVFTVGRHPHNKDIIMVFYRGAPEVVLESCTYLTQHSADSPPKKLSDADRAIIFDRVNRWRMLDMSVEALATCSIHISDAPDLFQRLSNRVKNMRTGKVQTILCDYDKQTISSCNQCKRKAGNAPCEFCDLARVLFRDLKESMMLGIVCFANRPAPSVAPVLKALGKSGIRFSWFGSSCEPAVLDFGKSLGLETDWNCCLSLQDLPEGVSSRLPAGVSAIKKHVESNDDVPLRVPMFCDATPSSVQSMIRLYQDNGEVVAVVGSSLKVENMEAFLAADLAFSVRPRVALRPSKVTEFHQQNNVLLAGKLISAPCTLTSDFSSEYFSSALIQKILVARLIYINSQQAVMFTAHAAALLILSQFFCCIVRMPSILSAGHMGFITLFLIPALSASCLLSPDHERFPIVKRIPDKQNEDDEGTLLRKKHMTYYSIALILPSAFLVFMTQLVSLVDLGSVSAPDVSNRPVFSPALIEQAQLTVLIWLVVFFHISAFAFLHRRVAPTSLHLRGNPLFIATFVVTALSSLILIMSNWSRLGCPSLQPQSAAPGICLIIWWLAAKELIRRHDARQLIVINKYKKFSFETKLGQLSPI